MSKNDFDVVIVGGGLAGLTSALLLSKAKFHVLLIEKKKYPFHKVCGEYVSNEVLNFLQANDFDPFRFNASRIQRLRISSPSGKNIYCNLDKGGFGLSRYCMDHELYKLAKKNGMELLTTRVNDINFNENYFSLITSNNQVITSKLVIGSYGKRDTLDKKLKRNFIQSHTGYMGVKYHIKTDYPVDEIGLDNFQNGYCGIGKIENDKYNLCYLYKRSNRFSFHSVKEIEEALLFQNPVIENIYSSSDFLFDEPEVINEISFAPKELIVNHILMCGDAAGLITPLCGNGMSMAIHAAKLLSEIIIRSVPDNESKIKMENRLLLEQEYSHTWKKYFNSRLMWGRGIQNFFGNKTLTEASVRTIHFFPRIEQWLISKTHGENI